MLCYFKLLSLVSLIFISITASGTIPASLSSDSDSTLISSLSVRIFLGTDSFSKSSTLRDQLRDQSIFDELDDFFISSGFSIGLGAPKLNDVSAGLFYTYYFNQTQYQHTDSSSRSLKLDGTSFGAFLERSLELNNRFKLNLGLRFLRNSMSLSAIENMGASNPNTSFNNSKSLEIEYKSNTINPYLTIEYDFIHDLSYDLSIGLFMDYKHILPTSPWKRSKTDTYNDWTYKNSNAVVDLPFFGNSVIGTGVFFTVRTYF